MTRAEQKHLATIFRRAANERLNDGVEGSIRWWDIRWWASCYALNVIENGSENLYGKASGLAKELSGHDTCRTWFDDIESGSIRQGARFLWLHMVAEGLERGLIP